MVLTLHFIIQRLATDEPDLLELARRGGPEMIVNTTLFDLSQFFHRIHKGKTQHNLTVVLVPEVGTKFGTGKDRYAA